MKKWEKKQLIALAKYSLNVVSFQDENGDGFGDFMELRWQKFTRPV